MPIRIDNELPAKQSLEIENIFVMSNKRADTQDIRPLHIIILNLMPTKIDTETQLLRLLSNTPLQVNVDFLQVSSHTAKHTSKSHMDKFYYTFDQIKDRKYDGMIITARRWSKCPLRKWTTGTSFAGSWIGQKPMYIAPSIFAGARKRGCTTTTVFQSTRSVKRCSAYSPTAV